jgi:hypothetical protein
VKVSTSATATRTGAIRSDRLASCTFSANYYPRKKGRRPVSDGGRKLLDPDTTPADERALLKAMTTDDLTDAWFAMQGPRVCRLHRELIARHRMEAMG